MSEKPVHPRPRRLADWINPTGAKKVHSLIDKVYKRKWKRFGKRVRELRKHGVRRDWAMRIASSGHGPWRLSQTPSLRQALPDAAWDALGVPRLAAGS